MGRNGTQWSCTSTPLFPASTSKTTTTKNPRPFHIFLSEISPPAPRSLPPSNIFLEASSLLFLQLQQWESNVPANRFSSFTPLHVTFNPKSHLDAVNQSHTIYFTIPFHSLHTPPKPFCCHPYPPARQPLTQIHSALKKGRGWTLPGGTVTHIMLYCKPSGQTP